MTDPNTFKIVLDYIDMPILAAEKTGSDYTIIYRNNSMIKALPLIKEEMLLSELKNSVTPNIDWLELARQAEDEQAIAKKAFLLEKKQVWYNLEIKFTPDRKLLIASLFDITTKTFYNEQLHQAIFTDTLTTLQNRIQFNRVYSQLVKDAEQNKRKFALILLDLDNMKATNDSKGQAEGDRVLIRTAQILKGFEKPDIKLFRFGDDEFSILATDIDSKNSAVTIGDAILETFMAANISLSAGIALYPEDSIDGEDLLKFADLAMHKAKEEGKHKLLCFTPEMHKQFLRKISYKNKMPEAFKNGDFELYFQPQFDIASNALRGFEALLRWNDSELGRISPEEFIPVAEESGFIVKLGDWILDTAFAFQKKWESSFPYNGIMSINVSPVQLKEKDFIFKLEETVKRNNIDPSHIEIEITEGVLIEDTDGAIKILNRIKEMGFGLSLDDFGTGYSSLRYLQILPLTTLKIDKSFIQSITEDGNVSADITNAIISMVTKMGLDTIAEGVEKTDQLALLKSLNCKNVQGFLRGKPMSSSKIETYLSGDVSALDSLQ